jgi:hypothetical protein
VRVTAVIALALAGLAVAVALSVAASNLSSQPVGLSGEPLRVGETLAPAVAKTPARPKAGGRVGKTLAKRRVRNIAKPGPVVTAPSQTTTTTSSERSEREKHESEPDDDD